MLSDDDIKKARELIEKAPEWIETENVGGSYTPYEQPMAESKAFYAAAREGWPAALDEVEAMRSVVEAACAYRDHEIEVVRMANVPVDASGPDYMGDSCDLLDAITDAVDAYRTKGARRG